MSHILLQASNLLTRPLSKCALGCHMMSCSTRLQESIEKSDRVYQQRAQSIHSNHTAVDLGECLRCINVVVGVGVFCMAYAESVFAISMLTYCSGKNLERCALSRTSFRQAHHYGIITMGVQDASILMHLVPWKMAQR